VIIDRLNVTLSTPSYIDATAGLFWNSSSTSPGQSADNVALQIRLIDSTGAAIADYGPAQVQEPADSLSHDITMSGMLASPASRSTELIQPGPYTLELDANCDTGVTPTLTNVNLTWLEVGTTL
jgi:hypothetical protein